jgi:cytochrome c5
VSRNKKAALLFSVLLLGGLRAGRAAAEPPSSTLPVTSTSLVVATTTLGEVTSTTLVEASTTTSSTTTTLASAVRCAQPRSSGALPTASDCLFILRSALGSSSCSPSCMCAPKGTLPVTATDALICLKRAIGQPIALHCGCGGETTTTLPVTTTTVEPTTTTLPVTTTSTTTSSSTTTTVLVGSVQIGQQIYDARCSVCHRAGNHDKDGFAPNLAGKGGLLVNDMSTIDPMMTGIMLTDKNILDLAAFFDSL